MARRQRRRRQRRRHEHAEGRGFGLRSSLITGAGISAGAALGLSSTASAATFQVDNTTDNNAATTCDLGTANDCSLRQAITLANSNADPSTIDYITFASSVTGTITLTHNQIPLTESAYVEGPGANALTVSGDGKSRIFFINPVVTDSPIAIYRLTLTDGADATGGAVYNLDADMKIAESTLTGNSASGAGGAVYDSGYSTSNGADDIIYASTVSGNTAGTLGGGIYGYHSIGTLSTSTVTGNHAGTDLGQDGAGVYSTYHAYIIDSTVAGNGPAEAGGGVASASSMTIYSSILADNNALVSPDFYSFSVGTSTAEFSLIENGAAITPGAGPNIIAQDPQLGPLQNNGGLTPTMKPAATSPVVDKGHNRFGRDQRLMPRTVDNPFVVNAPGGNGTDIGAVELTLAEGPQAVAAPPPVSHRKKCKKHKKQAASAKKCKKKKQ
jgi:hypothetical protein